MCRQRAIGDGYGSPEDPVAWPEAGDATADGLDLASHLDAQDALARSADAGKHATPRTADVS